MIRKSNYATSFEKKIFKFMFPHSWQITGDIYVCIHIKSRLALIRDNIKEIIDLTSQVSVLPAGSQESFG